MLKTPNFRNTSTARSFQQRQRQWNNNNNQQARNFATRRPDAFASRTATADAFQASSGGMFGLGALAVGVLGLSFFGWGNDDKNKNKELELFDTKTGKPTRESSEVAKNRTLPSASAYKEDKPDVVFWLGADSEGKHKKDIIKKYGYSEISAKDLVQSEIASGSERGQAIKKFVDAGEAVPAELILELVYRAISREPKKKFLLEDFPRTSEDAAKWDTYMKDKANLRMVLYVHYPGQAAIEPTTGKGQQVDAIGGLMKIGKAEKKEQAYPVLQYYGKTGLTTEIDATIATNTKKQLEDTFAHIEDVKRNA